MMSDFPSLADQTRTGSTLLFLSLPGSLCEGRCNSAAALVTGYHSFLLTWAGRVTARVQGGSYQPGRRAEQRAEQSRKGPQKTPWKTGDRGQRGRDRSRKLGGGRGAQLAALRHGLGPPLYALVCSRSSVGMRRWVPKLPPVILLMGLKGKTGRICCRQAWRGGRAGGSQMLAAGGQDR